MAFIQSMRCQRCGSEFKGRKRRYCSDGCMLLSRKKMSSNFVTAIKSGSKYRCVECSSIFSVVYSNGEFSGRQRKYCTEACATKSKSYRDALKKRGGKTKVVRNKGEKATRQRTSEQRKAERKRAAKKLGKSYKPRDVWISSLREKRMNEVSEQNARQAWDHWIKSKAPNWWVEKYYYSLGRPWSNPRLSKADRYRIRYNLDQDFSIKERLRRQMRKASNRDGIAETMRLAIRRGGGSRKVKEELGYSIQELKTHLEKQFINGMNWDAFMNGDIHIDHIVPQKAYDLSNRDEWRKCWCLSNLRPVWANENLKKGCKALFLL